MGRNDRRFGHPQEPGGNDVVDTYLSTLKARYWRAFLRRVFRQLPYLSRLSRLALNPLRCPLFCRLTLSGKFTVLRPPA